MATNPSRRTRARRRPVDPAEADGRPADRTVLQSVQRAARILDEIAKHRGPVTTGEIASALDLDRTITYRLLRTLEGEELVESVDGGYVSGRRALVFGNAYLENLPVLRAALPYQISMLDRVLKNRPWTIAIIIPVGSSEMALVDTVWNSAAPLDTQLSIGRRYSMATTALGHAMLAYRPFEEVVEAIGEERAVALQKEFNQIIESGGLAFDRDVVPGVSAIGAAILGRDNRVVAGMLLSGLELDEHLTPGSEVSQTIRRTADAISRALA